MGVKFGTQDRSPPPCQGVKFTQQGYPLLHVKFHSTLCNGKSIGPPKRKFLLKFDEPVEYKRPTGAYRMHDFHKICRVSTPFQAALDVKISLDLLEGLWSYGDFKLRGLLTPKFSAPRIGETMRQTPKVLEVQECVRGPVSLCHVWWGSDFTRRRRDQKR